MPEKKRRIKATLLDKAAHALTDDLALKLLALIFAVGIWAWVQSMQVVERRARARVHYTWPEGLVQVQEAPKTLVVTVKGPQGLVRTIDKRDLIVPVNLSDAEAGVVSIDYSAHPVKGLPSDVKVVQVSPPAFDLRLDKPMNRKVTISPVIIGEPAKGWKLVGTSVNPDRVEITGPRTLVRNISEVTTDVIDITGAKESKSVEVPLTIKEHTVKPIKDTPVHVAVDIEPVLSERTIDKVPVLARAQGWRVTPPQAKVTLVGAISPIEALHPDQVSVIVHLPSPAPTGDKTTVSFKQGAKDSAIEVVFPDARGQVHVKRIQPSTFTLERTP